MPAIPAVIAGVAAVGGAMISGNASKSAAKASAAGAQAAADAQLQSTQAIIARQEQAAAEGRAYQEPFLTGTGNNSAFNLMQGATGVNSAYTPGYNTAYGNSFWQQQANDATARAQQAALSTNAAAGRGGSFNSGKAIRALAETNNQLGLAGRTGHYNALAGIADANMAAATSSGNYGVGAAGVISNAFGQQAQNLGQIYQSNAANQANLAINQGNNMAGALGGIAQAASNINWGNALGGNARSNPTPVTTVPGVYTGSKYVAPKGRI